jgi:hypothetical protein
MYLLNVRDQVSHPYRTTGKIIVSYILIFAFLDTERKFNIHKLFNSMFENPTAREGYSLISVESTQSGLISSVGAQPCGAPIKLAQSVRSHGRTRESLDRFS